VRGNVALDLQSAPQDLSISADKGKLTQVIYNLLSNAIKFTPPGGRVIVAVLEQPDLIEISVQDTGVGIDPQDHERIFESFEQVSSSHNGAYRGTGLGLTLVRKFVEMHGGRIWVESEPGKGSRFIFTIPKMVDADLPEK
jgi:signal transduction histidine kinase